MFNNKKIKELELTISEYKAANEKLICDKETLKEDIRGLQYKLTVLSRPRFTCKDCGTSFTSPVYMKQKVNQTGKTRLVAICPHCGSTNLTGER